MLRMRKRFPNNVILSKQCRQKQSAICYDSLCVRSNVTISSFPLFVCSVHLHVDNDSILLPQINISQHYRTCSMPAIVVDKNLTPAY